MRMRKCFRKTFCTENGKPLEEIELKEYTKKSGSFKLQRKCDSVAGQAEAEGERLTSSASGA